MWTLGNFLHKLHYKLVTPLMFTEIGMYAFEGRDVYLRFILPTTWLPPSHHSAQKSSTCCRGILTFHISLHIYVFLKINFGWCEDFAETQRTCVSPWPALLL